MRQESNDDVSSVLSLSPERPTRRRLELRPARFDDYEQIARLSTFLNAEAVSLEDWRQLWVDSPLWGRVGRSWPIGWVLETADGEIVGSIENVPLPYQFRGEPLTAAAIRGWVVAPAHRGRYALALLQKHLNQPGIDLFLATTVGLMALSSSDKFGTRVPVGDWETIAYCVMNYRAFGTRALRKLNIPLEPVLGPLAGAALQIRDTLLRKRLPKAPSAFTVEATDRFDTRFDAFWEESLRQRPGMVLAARDSAALSWHFSVAMRKRRVWVLTASRNHRLRAYCIFKRKDAADELPRMRLVDYQTIDHDVDLLPALLGTALQRCAAENICVLDKAGVGILKMRPFDEFAPYRRKQSWPFFYRATDSTLAAQLSQPEVWDPSDYDGDSSIA